MLMKPISSPLPLKYTNARINELSLFVLCVWEFFVKRG